jgi:hypothetical protein
MLGSTWGVTVWYFVRSRPGELHPLPRAQVDRFFDGARMALVSEAAFGGIIGSEPSPRVVEASHRFVQRRLENVHQWKPSPAGLAELRALVNAKAGRRLL